MVIKICLKDLTIAKNSNLNSIVDKFVKCIYRGGWSRPCRNGVGFVPLIFMFKRLEKKRIHFTMFNQTLKTLHRYLLVITTIFGPEDFVLVGSVQHILVLAACRAAPVGL